MAANMIVDYKDIQEKFNKVITYSQGVSHPNTDKLFEAWAQNKFKLYKCFNYNLVVNYGYVTIEANDEDKRTLFGTLRKRINNLNDLLIRSGATTEQMESYDNFLSYLEENLDDLFKNCLSKEIKINNRVYKPPFKVNKIIKLIFEDNSSFHGDTVIASIQNVISQIIQSATISGELCFSIHPLDYLSISCNASGWRSCHALDGDFRSGNLDYMTNPSTFICYLKSSEDTFIKNFPASVPWNSKKWRMLLFTNEDYSLFMASKQYPMEHNALFRFVEQKMTELFQSISLIENIRFNDYNVSSVKIKENFNPSGNSVNKSVSNVMVDLYNGNIISTFSLFCDVRGEGDGTLFFNDLTDSTTYKPLIAKEDGIAIKHLPTIKLKGRPFCVCCGNRYIEESAEMMCFRTDSCTSDMTKNVCEYCHEEFWDKYCRSSCPKCEALEIDWERG